MKSGWPSKTLGEVCEFRGGGTPPKAVKRFWEGSIPWVSPKDMKCEVISDSFDHISLEAVESSATSLIPKDSVLMVVRSGILNRTVPIAITERELTINQDIKALCPKGVIDARFLYFLLHSKMNLLLSKVSKGATVHRLMTEDIRCLEFILPPLNEQKRISDILGKAFDGIATAKANAEKNLQNARALFEAYLQSVFTQENEGWLETTIGQHIRFIDYRGKTPQKTGNGLRLITAKNVKMGYVQETPMEFVAPNTYDSWMTRGIPRRGDVLFTTEAPLANVAQLETDDKVVFAQRIIIMQPDATKLDSTFLKYLLLSQPVQHRIRTKGTGATVQGIKASLLKTIEISFPPSLTMQRKIVKKLNSLHEETQRLESIYRRKIAALDELKKSLLHKAFTGEL
ncbi:MAG: restriction endonuclease subunit S [Acidobacteriota bacterium]|nr:restriction endonuclease subunit S [Acidobacteriota bacterium]